MRYSWFALLLGLPGLLSAQSDDRLRVLGRVVGRDGQPWAKAAVTLRSAPKIPEFGAPDVVQVEADARGRFRALLRRGRAYVAWAALRSDDGTRWTRSTPEVLPGQVVRLVEAHQQPMPIRVELVGLEAWKELGQVTMRLQSHARSEPVPQGKKSFVVAEGPETTITLELWLDGSLLHTWVLFRAKEQRAARHKRLKTQLEKGAEGEPVAGLPDVAKLPLPPLDLERVLLPLPLRQPVRVSDAETKQPIAGAQVILARYNSDLSSPRWTTNAEGEVEVPLFQSIDFLGRRRSYYSYRLHILARGYALKQGGWDRRSHGGLKPLPFDKIEDGRLPRLEMPLRKGPSARGRVVGTPERGGVGLTILCQIPGTEEAGGGGYYNFMTEERVRTGSDGSFEIHGLGGRSGSLRMLLLLPRDHLIRLFPDRAADFPPVARVPLPWPLGRAAVKADVEMPRVALDKLHLVRLELRLPDGRPAAFATVTTADARPGYQALDLTSVFANRAHADRRGHCAFVVMDRFRILASQDLGWAIETIDPAKVKGTHAVTLNDYATVQGRVVDGRGEPVTDANVHIYSTSSSGGDPLSSIVQQLNHRILQGETDDKGRFRLRFIPNPAMSYGVRAFKTVEGNSIQSDDLVQIGTESIEDAELRLYLPKAPADKDKDKR